MFPIVLIIIKINNFYKSAFQICLHHGTIANPDARDVASSLEKEAREIGSYIKEHFQDVEDRPSIVEQCMYTVLFLLFLIITRVHFVIYLMNVLFTKFLID